MVYQYKYKFYLNASHYIKIKNSNGEIHSHCFEIAIDIASTKNSDFTKFNDIEFRIEELLDAYQDKLLNEIPPFNAINPTIENICEYFKCIIASNLAEIGWVILTIEMSETPSRAYIINVIEEMESDFEEILSVGDLEDNFLDSLSEDIFSKIGKVNINQNNEDSEEIFDNIDDYDIPYPEKMYFDIEIIEGGDYNKIF